MDAALAAWCRRLLGAEPEAVLFRAGYPSEVTGLRLADGRGVVVKARAPSPRLLGCLRVQAALAAAGFPCPRPLAGPAPLDGLAATAEELVPGGQLLPPGPEAAAAVRARLAGLALGPVVGHADWESQNLRWDGGRPLAVHDWDSAVAQPEAVVAGLAAAVWPAAGGPGEAATVEQTEQFLSAYEHARGRPWTAAEGQARRRRWAGGSSGTVHASLRGHTRPPGGRFRWRGSRSLAWRRAVGEVGVVGVVESVNVGTAREISWRGQTIRTAIWKDPVAGRVRVRGTSVEGDEQGNPEVHGGVDQALYAYAVEDSRWWGGQLGRELGPGSFGENLTVRGIDVSGALVGERWRAGGTLLEVTSPRTPCFKLGIRMGSQEFPRRFAAAGRPGAYLRILAEGEVAAGDPVEVVHRPGHDLSVAEVSRIYHADHAGAARLLEVPELAETWKHWAERFAATPGRT